MNRNVGNVPFGSKVAVPCIFPYYQAEHQTQGIEAPIGLFFTQYNPLSLPQIKVLFVLH
tara:strand:- start:414 stop:590 length:177 start_codon:yes stop_codon:yes gene_type:complete